MSEPKYNDLRQHIALLRERKQVWDIHEPMNKDAEMHPFVRWQYRGGVPEQDRRAFLFSKPTDATGRVYENSVLVAGLAGTPDVYATGLQCELWEVPDRWTQAYANPIEPILVEDGPVHEVVLGPEDFKKPGGGLASLPVPISTPGFDNAPYLTSAHAVTKDPETGIRNIGHYRGQIKGQDRLACFFSASYKHGLMHWESARKLGQDLEVAFIIGAPPVVSYAAVQKVPFGVDEYDIAGGLAQEPIQLVKCRTVDLEVPADAEMVIEGIIRTDYIEQEGPFGESHGYVHPRSMCPMVEITAITHRKDYIFTSFISQVTPSESSVIKKVGWEPMLTSFLRDTLGVSGVKRVVMHEPLTNLRKVQFVQFKKGTKKTEVWRALKGLSAYRAEIGKIVIAVDEDIDPNNLDAVWWAIAYRCRPHKDIQVLTGQYRGHGPPFIDNPYDWEDSAMLIDATLSFDLPPVSLPTKEVMERAKTLWEKIADTHSLPPLTPESPWHGYVITESEWTEEFAEEAQLALDGRYYETGTKLAGRRQASK